MERLSTFPDKLIGKTMIANNLRSEKEIEKAYGAVRSIEAIYKKTLDDNEVQKLKAEGFDRVYLLEDKDLDTQVVIAANDTDVLLSVPGTVGMKDVLTDISGTYWLYALTLKRRDLSDAKERAIKSDMKKAFRDSIKKKMGIPHFGFYFSAWRICDLNEIMNVLDKEEVKTKDFTICGHSLGGAVAQHLAVRLSLTGFDADNVYTFGGPAPARRKFKKLFEKTFPNAMNFIHESDIVPFMAPRFMAFRRCGKEMFIDHENKITEGHVKIVDRRRFKGRKGNKKFDIVHDHFCPEYCDGLKHNV